MGNSVSVEKLKIDKSDWVLTPLGELATEVSNRVDNPAESAFDRFVGLEHFISGDLKIKKWGTTENLTSSAKAFQKGDILFARRNAYLRRASLADFDGCCSGDAFVLRENSEKVVPGFLAFIVNSDALWDYANANAAGTMSKRVKWRDLANYEFLLPPKEQQAELAELLWSMDAQITSQERLSRRLELYLQSYRKDFMGTIHNPKHQLFEIKDIGAKHKQAVQVGPFGGSVSSKFFKPEGVPVIKINNIDLTGALDLSSLVFVSEEHAEKLGKYKVEEGDILTAAQATTGRTALADKRISGALISQHLIRVAVDKSVCSPEYLYEVFSSDLIKYQINLVKAKTTRDGLNTADVASFKVPLPKSDEIEIFIRKIKSIGDARAKCNATLSRTTQLKKSLINQVF